MGGRDRGRGVLIRETEGIYTPKGEGSWKHQALATDKAKDDDHEVFPYRECFLASDWKLFHDAAIAHHFNLVHHIILPRYGICVGTG